MKQQSFAAHVTFEKYGRKGRRELFLDEMEQVVPCADHAADVLRAAVVQPCQTRV